MSATEALRGKFEGAAIVIPHIQVEGRFHAVIKGFRGSWTYGLEKRFQTKRFSRDKGKSLNVLVALLALWLGCAVCPSHLACAPYASLSLLSHPSTGHGWPL